MRATSVLAWTVAALGLAGEAAPAAFELSRFEGREVRVDAAYNPIEDQYLVVWEQNGAVWGKVLEGWGGTVREPFVIAGVAPTFGVTYTQPSVAFKSPENVYYVVMKSSNPLATLPWDNILLYRLKPDGSLDADEGRIGVRQLARGPGGTLDFPDVEADTFGTDCCVLAVWETVQGSLAGQRLTGAGELHGTALRIFDRGERLPAAFHPRIVYQRPTDSFVVAFDRHDSALSSSIAVRSLGAFGGEPGAAVTVATLLTRPPRPGRPAGHPDLAYNAFGREAGTDRFLVVWRDGDQVHHRRLSGARAPLGAAARLCSFACATARDLDEPAVGAETGTPFFVVTYTRTAADGRSTLRGSGVNGATGAFSEVFGLTEPTLEPSGNAALAWDAGRAMFLAVWEEDAGFPLYEDLWAGFLSRP
jgi:hypothetical protein